MSSHHHQSRLESILATPAVGVSPSSRFAGVSDDFWFWLFTEGYRANESRLRGLLPEMPPEAVQLRFTGASGDATLGEAFGFYQLVRKLAAKHRRGPVQTILDYGCGWGRIIRFFLRDVNLDNLIGIDCYPEMIDLCRATNPFCRFELVDPYPPTRLSDNSFDIIYSYSVFSHLSEEAHLAWLEEFRRVLKPGGLLIATTRARNFVLECAEMRRQQEQRFWMRGAAASFMDTDAALARYDRGEYLYEAVGGGGVLDSSFFGETCIPRAYVERRWTTFFDFVDFIDNRKVSIQNVAVVRKPLPREHWDLRARILHRLGRVGVA